VPPDSIVYDTLGKVSSPYMDVLDNALPPHAVPPSLPQSPFWMPLFGRSKGIVIGAILHAKRTVHPIFIRDSALSCHRV
jgi:hypothetical protein